MMSFHGPNAQAQWTEKIDVDLEAGYPSWSHLSLQPGGFEYGSTQYQGTRIYLTVGGTLPNSSYEVIVKAYGPNPEDFTPLFSKLMSTPAYTGPIYVTYGGATGQKVQAKSQPASNSSKGGFAPEEGSTWSFISDFSHPSDPTFVLPIGKCLLIAEVYQVTDGMLPEDDWTKFGDVLEAEGIDASGTNLPELWSRKVATSELSFVVSALDVFQANYVGAGFNVSVTSVYNAKINSTQKKNLDAKAAALLKTETNNLKSTFDSFAPYAAPNSQWLPEVTINKPKVPTSLSSRVSVWGLIASDKAEGFSEFSNRLVKKQTITYPEGKVTVAITGDAWIQESIYQKTNLGK